MRLGAVTMQGFTCAFGIVLSCSTTLYDNVHVVVTTSDEGDKGLEEVMGDIFLPANDEDGEDDEDQDNEASGLLCARASHD